MTTTAADAKNGLSDRCGAAFKNKAFKDEFVDSICRAAYRADEEGSDRISVRRFNHTDSKSDFSFSKDSGATAVGVKVLVAEQRKNFDSYRFSAKGRYPGMVVVLVATKDGDPADAFPETYVAPGSHPLLMKKYETSLKTVNAAMKKEYLCASFAQVASAIIRAASGEWKDVDVVEAETLYKPRKDGTVTVADARPDLVREWSPKNAKGPDKYLVMSNKRVAWVCEKAGHEWEAAVCDRFRGTGCKVCLGRVATEERNFANEPGNASLLEEYADDNHVGPTDVTPYSNEVVKWRCSVETCKFEWKAPFFARTMGKNACPSCTFTATTPLNCLRVTGDPAIVAELDEEASGFTAEQVTQYSRRKGVWKCRECSHRWETSVIMRMFGKGCLMCFHCPDYRFSFAAMGDPEMVAEMMREKSGFGPDRVTAWSTKRAWWKCRKCDYEWQAKVQYRFMGRGCHACAGKVATSKNSLRALGDPVVVSELDEALSGYSADDVVFGSDRNLWWRCKKCNVPWRAMVSSRTKKGTGCPRCCNACYSKKQIVWLDHVAKRDNIDIQHIKNGGEYRIPSYNSSRFLKVDGYCRESNTIYEFFGTYYHGDLRVYQPDFMNDVVGKTMGELYDETERRIEHIKSLGYTVVVMWEKDFDADTKNGVFSF